METLSFFFSKSRWVTIKVTTDNEQLEKAVEDGGSYAVIRARLDNLANELNTSVTDLNTKREGEFGKTILELKGRTRIRTENNCIPRDIVRVGNYLLFAYNVFIGLKSTVSVKDVLTLCQLKENNGECEVEEVPLENTFLDDPRFLKDFGSLYNYYKDTSFSHLRVTHNKLLAEFRIGRKVTDVKVFRWSIVKDDITYIDDRGAEDMVMPPSHDFEWTEVVREDFVEGEHPHVSIYDEVFIETVGGDLTIKVENNTESGEGIYAEPVEDVSQDLGDARIYYARSGGLILAKVLPYNEECYRYFAYSPLTQEVVRADEIGDACINLPEDHGIIYPSGYMLTNGENRRLPDSQAGLKFKRKISSPNGEDVLYVFYEPEKGFFALYSYNIITKELQTPLYCNGYSLYEDGTLVIFKEDLGEPTRVHQIQIWETSYQSDLYASNQPVETTFLASIGNAELVRGISELKSIERLVNSDKVSSALYEEIIKHSKTVKDSYFWMESKELSELGEILKRIIETSELVLDEYEKVVSISKQSERFLKESQESVKSLITDLRVQSFDRTDDFVEFILKLNNKQGELISLRDKRYIDLKALAELEKVISEEVEELGKRAVTFMSSGTALDEYAEDIDAIYSKISELTTSKDINQEEEKLTAISEGLDSLTDVINGLTIDDINIKTSILESISTVYSKVNQTKAHARLTLKEVSGGESKAEFGARIAVLSQAISNGLTAADTPEECDDELAKILITVEGIEGAFGDDDEFLEVILEKRDEIHTSFESKKQKLVDARQRKAQSIHASCERVLQNIERRASKMDSLDTLNTYFSSDHLSLKIDSMIEQLRELGDSVKADDISSKKIAAKDNAIRAMRDKTDIFEDGGKLIKLGRHRFSVNQQNLDLTILPKDGKQFIHLTGTDFYQPISNDALNGNQEFWDQHYASENGSVYRGEYLAYNILNDAISSATNEQLEALNKVHVAKGSYTSIIDNYIKQHPNDGYEKGVHDLDADKILSALMTQYIDSPWVVYPAKSKVVAMWFWTSIPDDSLLSALIQQAKGAKTLKNNFQDANQSHQFNADVLGMIKNRIDASPINLSLFEYESSAQYLADVLAATTTNDVVFEVSNASTKLAKSFTEKLQRDGIEQDFQAGLESLDNPLNRLVLGKNWLAAFDPSVSEDICFEASATLVLKGFESKASGVSDAIVVEGLLSEHPNIAGRQLSISANELFSRVGHYSHVVVPQYQQFQQVRRTVIQAEKAKFDADSYKARPLTSFVRNKLINDSYLPIIGDNFAKQIGAAGVDKRTDLMGMLLLISPPGYGKTTLMEYTASRLGLNFMKINCPSIGHDVKSLDPETAPNSTARQELEKLNLALKMGNNVMLYLDDIQHTHPEFLQKFISLCDGTRRIEGVWEGDSQTFDLRGKRFCVVMAGNPYTESGEVFKIPDMLANRADVYNLGDILSGQYENFTLSYIENSLTSNPYLAPLALRDINDLYLFIDKAKGKEVPEGDFSYSYSASESSEIVSVLQKMLKAQELLLLVNKEYIRSAAMDNNYREEPPFKLQGSYRNMNKIAEKIVPAMDNSELMQLLGDHYLGESQLLTGGAEENLLKLKELRGILTEEEQARWSDIKSEFRKRNSLGGDDDAGTKISSELLNLGEKLEKALLSNKPADNSEHEQLLNKLTAAVEALAKKDVIIENQANPELENSITELIDKMTDVFLPSLIMLNKKSTLNSINAKKLMRIIDKLQN